MSEVQEAELQRTIDSARRGGFEEANRLLLTDEGKRLMDTIRRVLQDMMVDEQALFDQRVLATLESKRQARKNEALASPESETRTCRPRSVSVINLSSFRSGSIGRRENKRLHTWRNQCPQNRCSWQVPLPPPALAS